MKDHASKSQPAMIRKMFEELGRAYAEKFRRMPIDQVYHPSVSKVSNLFLETCTDAAGIDCCYPDKTTHSVCNVDQCTQLGGDLGACPGRPRDPGLKEAQGFVRKLTKVLGNAYAGKLEQAGAQSKKVHKDILKKLAGLWKDANDGLEGVLVTCSLPDGTVSGMTKEQCLALGGEVAK